MIRKLIAPTAALALIYLLASFILWEWNPEQWGLGGRYLAAVFGFAFGGTVFVAQKELA